MSNADTSKADIKMEISAIFFYAFAALAIAFSLLVVFKENPVASAFSLVMVFFSFAGIYAVMNAHLIAALQIIVYTGAIMVLFVFVIMLLNADVPSLDIGRSSIAFKAGAFAGCAMLLVFTVWAIKESPQVIPSGNFTVEAVEAAGGNTQVISELMFSEYILPFELTSVLLLAAIVAAVAIAKRKLGGDDAAR